VFTRSCVPLKHGFHDSEREFQDSAVNVFSGRQNALSDLTRCVIRVLPWPLTLAANLVFSHDHEFKLSHFQVAIKEKMCSNEATNSCSMGLRLSKNRIFKPPKWRKWVRTKLRRLEREFQDLAVNIFSGRRNARSELTRCVVRVWPWPLNLATNLVFSHDLWT